MSASVSRGIHSRAVRRGVTRPWPHTGRRPLRCSPVLRGGSTGSGVPVRSWRVMRSTPAGLSGERAFGPPDLGVRSWPLGYEPSCFGSARPGRTRLSLDPLLDPSSTLVDHRHLTGWWRVPAFMEFGRCNRLVRWGVAGTRVAGHPIPLRRATFGEREPSPPIPWSLRCWPPTRCCPDRQKHEAIVNPAG